LKSEFCIAFLIALLSASALDFLSKATSLITSSKNRIGFQGMNIKLKTLSLTTVLAVMASGAFAQERTLNVYNWSDYIDESILTD
jgi:spermidine/putrescine-binding protein